MLQKIAQVAAGDVSAADDDTELCSITEVLMSIHSWDLKCLTSYKKKKKKKIIPDFYPQYSVMFLHDNYRMRKEYLMCLQQQTTTNQIPFITL